MTDLATRAQMERSAEEIVSKLGWMRNVFSNFAPFNPELRNMEVSFRTREAVVKMYVRIPDTIRDKLRRKILIPKHPGLALGLVKDQTFREYPDLWQDAGDGKHWIIRRKDLPLGENFQFEFFGILPPRAMQYLVRIQPAANRDTDGAYDKYWLNSMIRDVSIVKKIWDELQILDVEVNVVINIQQLVATIIPPNLRSEVKAFQEFVRVGQDPRSRSIDLMRARSRWLRSRRTGTSLEEFIENSRKLATPSFFDPLLKADKPYRKVQVNCGNLVYGFIPERIQVDLATDLNLDHPAATGFLRFHRQEYEVQLEQFIEGSYQPKRGFKRKNKRKSKKLI